MTTPSQQTKPVTASEIREILGSLDDAVVTAILALGATRDEIREAQAWLNSDDYLHRALHHQLSGRAAEVFRLLEEELPEPEQR